MVGLIHRLFFDHLEDAVGAATATAVKRRVGIPEGKTYRMDEFYPELEWQQSLAADKALYLAKEGGRNPWVSAGDYGGRST